LKTKRNKAARINLVGFGPAETERIRASLSRSPFCYIDSQAPLPEEEVDLYIAPASAAIALLNGEAPPGGGRPSPDAATSLPVIAAGRAAHMRAAFLSGASDFLKEPWTPEELELRAAGIMEKRAARFDFPWGILVLDGNAVRMNKTALALTLHQSRVLRVLLLNRGRPVPRGAIAYRLWGRPGPKGSRSVDVHVAAIRKKIRAALPEAGRFIKAARNEGYMIE
jgi:hypothetical protein